VIVGEFGETILIDWGLAKDLRGESEELEAGDGPHIRTTSPGLTAVGTVLGTPAYMPPEQARGEEVDERADVYALGAMLYAVLAGRAPFGGTSEAALESVLDRAPDALASIADGVPRDLAAIVDKAMQRDPALRYQNAERMAADLRRFRTGQLVGAHYYSPRDRIRRWVGRHKTALIVAAALVTVLVVVATLSVQRIVSERDEKERARVESEQRANELVLLQARGVLDDDPTETMSWLDQYDIQPGQEREIDQLASEARRRGVADHLFRVDARGRDMALTKDGRRLATAHVDGTVYVRELATGETWTFERPTAGSIEQVMFVGERVMLSGPGGVYAWTPETGATSKLELAVVRGDRLTSSADGERVYVNGDGGEVIEWVPSGGTDSVVHRHRDTVSTMTMAPDGVSIVSGGNDQRILWTSPGGETRALEGHRSTVLNLAFSPDGSLLASGGLDQTILLWDVSTGESRLFEGHEQYITALAFAPDGRTLASASGDRTVRIWDVQSGKSRALTGHEGQLGNRLVFTSDGSTLVSSDSHGSVRVWHVASGDSYELRGHRGYVRYFAASDDRTVLATFDQQGEARVWSFAPRESILHGHTDQVIDGALSSDSARLVTASRDHTARVWNLDTGDHVVLGGHDGWVFHADFVGDSHRVVTASADGVVRLWNGDTGELERAFESLVGQAFRSYASPRGDIALVIGERPDEKLWIYDLGSGERHKLGELGGMNRLRAEIVAGGDRALVVLDERVQVWDLVDRTLVGEMTGAIEATSTPDGSTIVVITTDHAIERWDPGSGKRTELARTESRPYCVAITRAGDRVITAHADGGILVHDVATGAVSALRRMATGGFNIALSPDEHHVAVGSFRGGLRVWRLDSDDVRDFRGHRGSVSALGFVSNDELVTAGQDGLVRRWSPVHTLVAPSR
jgi:WD40 repeat protein